MARILLVSILLLFAFPAAAEQLVVQGNWVTADYPVRGVWRIVEDRGRLSVRLGEDFETKNGPDLHILLSPRSFSEVTNDNASDQALVVGLLKTSDTSLLFKKMKGAQDLPLPDQADLSEYHSILIHCVRFSHLWAGADLPQ